MTGVGGPSSAFLTWVGGPSSPYLTNVGGPSSAYLTRVGGLREVKIKYILVYFTHYLPVGNFITWRTLFRLQCVFWQSFVLEQCSSLNEILKCHLLVHRYIYLQILPT